MYLLSGYYLSNSCDSTFLPTILFYHPILRLFIFIIICITVTLQYFCLNLFLFLCHGCICIFSDTVVFVFPAITWPFISAFLGTIPFPHLYVHPIFCSVWSYVLIVFTLYSIRSITLFVLRVFTYQFGATCHGYKTAPELRIKLAKAVRLVTSTRNKFFLMTMQYYHHVPGQRNFQYLIMSMAGKHFH